MKFACSVNTTVANYVDSKTGKIQAGGDFSKFNQHWEAKNIDALDLSEYIALKSGLCAWQLQNGKREAKNTGLIQAGLIIVDIDNQADKKGPNGEKVQQQELTYDEALNLDVCQKYLSFAYDSPSGSESWPRFRLVFGLEKPILDPKFYQWFSKTIGQKIPGSDFRAFSVPHLFYGAHGPHGILTVTDKFIPSQKIDEAYQHYCATVVDDDEEESDGHAALSRNTPDPQGLSLVKLCSRLVRNVLDGEDVEDRSATMANIFKELIGWSNWLYQHGLSPNACALTIAQQAFYNVYSYPYDLEGKHTGKFARILNSIGGAKDLLPAIALASEKGEAACWKKVATQSPKVYEDKAPDDVKKLLSQSRPKPSNNILSLEDFSPENTSTSQEPMSKKTSEQNTDVIDLASGKEGGAASDQKAFAENNIADSLYDHLGENFIYDSNLDRFYTYDTDLGIWYSQDEQHIKAHITKACDLFVKAGILAKYTATTIESVYKILKSKMLRSYEGGRKSIWSAGRSFIPFQNGVLDSDTMDFKPGLHKDKYLRSKLAFDYDDQADCPEFLQWLRTSLRAGQEVLIQAYARALLTGYTSGERFLHLVGPGGTGKSTMQQLMIALAGFAQTHTSSLEIIETNKFETYNLMGKRLLLLTDESNYNKRMDVLKKLTSASDTLRAERKYGKEIISFKPELLVCIASNEHISSNDSSSGLERRRLTIVMDKVVPPSSRRQLLDVHEDRIEGVFVPEMSGIVTWALSMSFDKMRDVLSNPVKHVPSISTTNLEALTFNNQFVAWMSECCLYAPNHKTPIGRGALKPSADEQERGLLVKDAYSELYASYSQYCRACGFRACTKPNFTGRVKETLQNILKLPYTNTVIKDGKLCIQGLRLKKYDLLSDRASSGDNRLPTPIEFAEDPDFTKWEKAFQKHDQV